MHKLLSLPPNLVNSFHEVENLSRDEWFCTSDPADSKLGSGGGTTWLLEECMRAETAGEECFEQWLGKEKRILLHAGGESRRLPSYASSGKVLTPVPVFRWERGQKLGQNLLSLQMPLYEKIMKLAPDNMHTLIASGDVYIRAAGELQPVPDVDVVCYGLWVDPVLATHHGVFVSDRRTPERLEFMLQKPSLDKLRELTGRYLFLMDIGVWLLSDRAVSMLRDRSRSADGQLKFYDLYSEFGCALGAAPSAKDEGLASLSVAILPLPGGEFYHYGTSRELISSTCKVQTLVNDQREIMLKSIKPNADLFTQNARVGVTFGSGNRNIWIENSCVGSGFTLTENHILTGIPDNSWTVSLPAGVCVDVAPVGESSFALRPYGIDDLFKGNPEDKGTLYMGMPFVEWCSARGIRPADIPRSADDMQYLRLFPLCSDTAAMGEMLKWMIDPALSAEGGRLWQSAEKLSASELSARANLVRLYAQRRAFMNENWQAIAANYRKSVFYQINLADAAQHFVENNIPLPAPLPEDENVMTLVHDHAFRGRVMKLRGEDYAPEQEKAFALLRRSMTEALADSKVHPVLDVYQDQIVWGRCPVRIDLAGGWTDTPPYSLFAGGNVVNMAVELNGQPPLQVYVKPCRDHHVILRSIDLGAMEVIDTFDDIRHFNRVGSPFSIPKAALALAGFLPEFCDVRYPSLEAQLQEFGSGIEITLLSAVPAGSGLGTSSILASTVLGALSDFCKLGWDKNAVCNRTLVLEQMLTTGGGWQDQYGGVLHGIKLLQTGSGFDQTPQVSWLPDYLFTDPLYRDCHLLYYTGITRVAKNILAEIVEGMFLNSTSHLSLLGEMKAHALGTYRAVQRGNFEEYGRMVGKTWEQNKALDAGTNPAAVEKIIALIKDYTLGYKLPGAGGGGFLYMVAKDVDAARRIRTLLTECSPNRNARFVDMNLSNTGLKISRS